MENVLRTVALWIDLLLTWGLLAFRVVQFASAI